MLKFEEKKLGGGAMEIGVRSAVTSQLVAVITHPCAGAKWFIHQMGNYDRMAFRTKKEAMQKISEIRC
jgi:hypothetical protein